MCSNVMYWCAAVYTLSDPRHWPAILLADKSELLSYEFPDAEKV